MSKNQTSKAHTLKFFSILSFVISASFSIINFWGTTTHLLIRLIMSAMGICMEYGKVTFLYKFMTEKVAQMAVKLMSLFVYIMLVSFSIFFSMALTSNLENENLNKTMEKSEKYIMTKNSIEGADKEIQRLISEKAKLENDYNNTINEMIKNKAKLPSNYITERNRQQKAIDDKQAEKTNKLLEAEKDIEKAKSAKTVKETEFTSLKPSDIEIKDTSGFTAMLRPIQEMVNSNLEPGQKPVSLDTVRFWFYLILSIAFELMASLLWYYGELETEKQRGPYESNYYTPAPPQVSSEPVHGEPVIAKKFTMKKQKRIGFGRDSEVSERIVNTDVQGFSKEELKRYLEYMYTNSKNNESVGYIKISKNANLGLEKTRKMKAFLEGVGVLKTDGTKTKIEVDYNTAVLSLKI